jgi:hypothetical protein
VKPVNIVKLLDLRCAGSLTRAHASGCNPDAVGCSNPRQGITFASVAACPKAIQRCDLIAAKRCQELFLKRHSAENDEFLELDRRQLTS